jgi:hypothetical protein
MNENKQVLLESQLAAARKNLDKVTRELTKLKADYKQLWEENLTLKRTQAKPAPQVATGPHIRVRKNGKEHTSWGLVMSVVRRSKDLTARELSHITGFDRYAIYAAARRAKIKLKPANG